MNGVNRESLVERIAKAREVLGEDAAKSPEAALQEAQAAAAEKYAADLETAARKKLATEAAEQEKVARQEEERRKRALESVPVTIDLNSVLVHETLVVMALEKRSLAEFCREVVDQWDGQFCGAHHGRSDGTLVFTIAHGQQDRAWAVAKEAPRVCTASVEDVASKNTNPNSRYLLPGHDCTAKDVLRGVLVAGMQPAVERARAAAPADFSLVLKHHDQLRMASRFNYSGSYNGSDFSEISMEDVQRYNRSIGAARTDLHLREHPEFHRQQQLKADQKADPQWEIEKRAGARKLAETRAARERLAAVLG